MATIYRISDGLPQGHLRRAEYGPLRRDVPLRRAEWAFEKGCSSCACSTFLVKREKFRNLQRDFGNQNLFALALNINQINGKTLIDIKLVVCSDGKCQK